MKTGHSSLFSSNSPWKDGVDPTFQTGTFISPGLKSSSIRYEPYDAQRVTKKGSTPVQKKNMREQVQQIFDVGDSQQKGDQAFSAQVQTVIQSIQKNFLGIIQGMQKNISTDIDKRMRHQLKKQKYLLQKQHSELLAHMSAQEKSLSTKFQKSPIHHDEKDSRHHIESNVKKISSQDKLIMIQENDEDMRKDLGGNNQKTIVKVMTEEQGKKEQDATIMKSKRFEELFNSDQDKNPISMKVQETIKSTQRNESQLSMAYTLDEDQIKLSHINSNYNPSLQNQRRLNEDDIDDIADFEWAYKNNESYPNAGSFVNNNPEYNSKKLEKSSLSEQYDDEFEILDEHSHDQSHQIIAKDFNQSKEIGQYSLRYDENSDIDDF